ncbi:MAG: UPF0280 family protein, partial [Alphaproteobacteria bacterium]|nr:UPF0280 family protein [Alphaproteobacteria bacterium]
LVIEAWGPPEEIRAAYRQAIAAFDGLLETLAAELPTLRAQLGTERPTVAGPVARRMVAACWPYRGDFITPMAAVAGAVADHVLAAMVGGRQLAKAYVNDGGDIALHLTGGERLTCGVVADLKAPAISGSLIVDASMPIRGIATSGAATKGTGGRSFSLGIADAVTVLARSGAEADAAATIIANAVNLPGHEGIERCRANAIDPDSDLGDRLVTMAVPRLARAEIERALHSGLAVAEALHRDGRIVGAVLALQNVFATCGADHRRLAA